MRLSKKTLLTCLALLLALLFGLILSRSGMTGEARPSLQSVHHWGILLDYDPDETKGPGPTALGPGPIVTTAPTPSRFEMVILDPDSHPPLQDLKGKVILIAYLSVGEAESYRAYWNEIQGKPWVLHENPNWPENYFVDVRNPEWKRLLVEEVIRPIVEQGFQGLMLDTLDTASYLEELSGERYAGMSEAMIDLVKTIRDAYPDLFLIPNNGLEILRKVGPYLDGVLVEDIFSQADFERGGYQKVPEESRQYKLGLLRKIREDFGLPIFVIDYVDSKKRGEVQSVRTELQSYGFKPYIAEKNLDRIYPQE